MQPWWVQTALNALNVPAVGCVTTTLSSGRACRRRPGRRLAAPERAGPALAAAGRCCRSRAAARPTPGGAPASPDRRRQRLPASAAERSQCRVAGRRARAAADPRHGRLSAPGAATGCAATDSLVATASGPPPSRPRPARPRLLRRRPTCLRRGSRLLRRRPLPGCRHRRVADRSAPGCPAGTCRCGWSATFAISSGVPSATTRPPPLPPSGPMSITQSAVLITSRLCSITITVLPWSTRPVSTPSSLRMSSKCRPVVGSSST